VNTIGTINTSALTISSQAEPVPPPASSGRIAGNSGSDQPVEVHAHQMFDILIFEISQKGLAFAGKASIAVAGDGPRIGPAAQHR
jgi:hypothetical protein